MEQWQVQRTAGKCTGTEHELTPGEEYYAALIETDEGFERRDYSLQFWTENQPEVYCFWKTRVPIKEEKKKLLVDNSVLTNIFERLENEDDQVKINFRFVLALILMRKRILKYEDTKRQDDKEIWQMKFVKDTKIHQVTNPQLDDEQIEKVSRELSTILNGDF